MPYKNVPKQYWKKMDDCVKDVIKTGKDKESAIKICYTALNKKYHFDKSEALWIIENLIKS